MPVPTKQQFEFVPFENYHTGGKLYNCDVSTHAPHEEESVSRR